MATATLLGKVLLTLVLRKKGLLRCIELTFTRHLTAMCNIRYQLILYGARVPHIAVS